MSSMETEVRLCEQRRDGNGTLTSPVTRLDGRCAAENCPHLGQTTRVTNPGFFVVYCAAHAQEAERLFGS